MRRIFEAVYQVFFDKKWGILIKMESESLMYSGLEIPRDYFNIKGEVLWLGLSTYSYGICLFSMEVLQDFLKKEKIRSKKLLHKFQKDKKLYLAMQKEGIWFPISKINSGQHLIKLEGYDNTFNDEWEQKFEIEGFNLKIEGGLWISDIGSFYTFNEAEFCGEAISFKTGDGDIQYSDFKYDVPAGKYLLSVKGFLRKEKKGFPNPNSGFLFSLVKVDEFSGFKNPREDIYNFNVTNM